MTYKPKPIDTTNVRLNPEIAALVEKLAANNHDHWALGRIAEGWTFGPNRDDSAKRHPCLRPYEELPESEKEYDRVTVREAIKSLLALGFTASRRAE